MVLMTLIENAFGWNWITFRMIWHKVQLHLSIHRQYCRFPILRDHHHHHHYLSILCKWPIPMCIILTVFEKLQDFFVGHPAFHRQYCRFPIPHHHHYHQHLQYPRNLHDTKSWLTMHSCAQRKFQAFRKGENGKPRPLVHNFKFCGNLRSLWICFRKIRNLWTSTVYHPEKLQTKVLDM